MRGTTLFSMALFDSHRPRYKAIVRAWDDLCAELIYDGDMHAVRGVSWRFRPVPLLRIYSDDPERSASIAPTIYQGFPVELLPSSAR